MGQGRDQVAGVAFVLSGGWGHGRGGQGTLYSEVQCMMGSDHMGTFSVDRITDRYD